MEEVAASAVEFKVTDLLSVTWWLNYFLDSYTMDPYHTTIELLCILVILYLVFKKETVLEEPLTKKEEEKLIAEWDPKPLVPPNTGLQVYGKQLGTKASPLVNISEKKGVLSFSSSNMLGMANNPKVISACKKTIEKYGVGSCGPRGFYGSIDVHIDLEKKMTEFIGSEASILYSDGIANIASVIPAFAKRGDLIVCDEGAHHAIQTGISLSRSNVLYFKHNDMDDLESILKDLREKEIQYPPKKLRRKFIVAEGVSLYLGDICPLDELVRLKNNYKFRLILDDSLGVGTVGKTGRGVVEMYDQKVNEDGVDIWCANIDAALGSVGGICSSSEKICSHQRLSGLGYCYSASSPPYTATAATTALDLIDSNPKMCKTLQDNAIYLRKALKAVKGFTVYGGIISSPVIHLHLAQPSGDDSKDFALMSEIGDRLLSKQKVMVSVPRYLQEEDSLYHPPSLRLYVTLEHTKANMDQVVRALAAAFDP